MRTILQTEASECGLACLAMVADAHGLRLDMAEMRRKFSISLKGTNLEQLVRFAEALSFTTRAVRLELDELELLDRPCILHWDLKHFVVLRKVQGDTVHVIDPAFGPRKMTRLEVGRHFTGVALELQPGVSFAPKDDRAKLRLSQLIGHHIGLKRSLIQIFILSIVGQVLGLTSPLLNQYVLDDVLASRDMHLLPVIITGFGLVMVTNTCVALARNWMVVSMNQSISLQWAANMFRHLVKLPTMYFEKRHLGDVMSKFGSLGAIQSVISVNAVTAILDAIFGLAAIVMMAAYSPKLTVIALLTSAAYCLLRLTAYPAYREASSIRLNLAAKENSHLIETLRAIVPIKLYGKGNSRISEWQNLRVDVLNRDAQTAIMDLWFGSANTFLFGLHHLATFYVGASMIMQESPDGTPFTIGMLMAFGAYSGQFLGRIGSLINYGFSVRMLSIHTERLADIVLEPAEDERKDSLLARDLDTLPTTLELKNVSFRYGDCEPWILKNVNLSLGPNDNVAIVGASGGGKSTLLKIMLGLVPPLEGEVLFGGVPINSLGLGAYRQLIGTVMQDDQVLAGTVRDNVAFFEHSVDDELLAEVTRAAHIYDEINRMPMGFQTFVGDMGSALSGGQKQRLLIARCLYKRPRILAMDEATSHLDNLNEEVINENIVKRPGMKIYVAHRESTIRRADRILEVKDGGVTERPVLRKEAIAA